MWFAKEKNVILQPQLSSNPERWVSGLNHQFAKLT